MQMPGRHGNTSDYRYGFQGQETDDEITWSESHVSYKYRMHDARLGRFLSLDPLAPEYPHNSPYAFSENRVIDGIELEGLEFLPTTLTVPRIFSRLRLPEPITIPFPRFHFPPPPTAPVPPITTIPSETFPGGITVPNIQSGPQSLSPDQIDWGQVDTNDPSTWPGFPPLEGQGQVKQGESSRPSHKGQGRKRLYDEKGREYRPHKPDKYHPEGHWDVKDGGKHGQWRNFTPDGVEIPHGMTWGKDWFHTPISTVIITPNTQKEWMQYEFKKIIYDWQNRAFELQFEEYKEELRDFYEQQDYSDFDEPQDVA
jgi:RHS repeat-associated protein